MNDATKDEFKNWKSRWGLTLIGDVKTDRLEWALGCVSEASSLSLDDIGDLMFVLSSHHTSLAAEMGRTFARLKWSNGDVDRAKLNMIKPIVESIELKITVLKKLFDRKVREDMRSKQ